MFGKDHGKRNIVDYSTKEVELSSGTAIKSIYRLKNKKEDHLLIVTNFPNKDVINKVKASLPNIKINGYPNKKVRNQYFEHEYLYLSLDDRNYYHISYFSELLEKWCVHSNINNDSNKIRHYLEHNTENTRTFLLQHLEGWKQGFGYHLDKRKWMRINDIYSQKHVGETYTCRIITNSHIHKIIDKLNEKFPDGKKG